MLLRSKAILFIFAIWFSNLEIFTLRVGSGVVHNFSLRFNKLTLIVINLFSSVYAASSASTAASFLAFCNALLVTTTSSLAAANCFLISSKVAAELFPVASAKVDGVNPKFLWISEINWLKLGVIFSNAANCWLFSFFIFISFLVLSRWSNMLCALTNNLYDSLILSYSDVSLFIISKFVSNVASCVEK